jgi:very-short-patch-repair endonuclease
VERALHKTDAGNFWHMVCREFENQNALNPYRDAVKVAPTWRDRLVAIRSLYRVYERVDADFPEIDPYTLGIYEHYTPIERALWKDIRSTARVHFLPQFPVGRFFVDFGDPGRKIAIEADGKQFHEAGRDQARDDELFSAHGWRVFRVSGAETVRVLQSPAEFIASSIERTEQRPTREQLDEVARRYYMTTSEGVIRAIRDVLIDGTHDEFTRWKIATLNAHRLANFVVSA